MPVEPANQSRLRTLKIVFIGIALASVAGSASAAERKADHAAVWGPMFVSQVSKCWAKPVDGDATVQTAFKISLTRDGMLAEQPVVEKPATSDYDRAYQASAVRALNACQPYKLPIEYYDEWKLFAPVFSEKNRKAKDDLFYRLPSICKGC
jgi:colicin import membrane protein